MGVATGWVVTGGGLVAGGGCSRLGVVAGGACAYNTVVSRGDPSYGDCYGTWMLLVMFYCEEMLCVKSCISYYYIPILPYYS